MQHDWIKSTLGHGNMMCSRCFVTDLEAGVLGILNQCDAAPKPANENAPKPATHFRDDDDDAYDDDGPEPGEECGRWANGALTRYCSKAGTEECDFECPYR